MQPARVPIVDSQNWKNIPNYDYHTPIFRKQIHSKLLEVITRQLQNIGWKRDLIIDLWIDWG